MPVTARKPVGRPSTSPNRAFPSRARQRAVPAALLAIALFAASAQAGDHEDVLDLFGSMTSALSQANAPLFLKGIDKSSPDYEKLAAYIPALVAQGDAASSLEFLKDEGNSQKRSVEIDWFLELRNVNPAGPLVRRREIIKCRLEKQKKKWRVVALSPVDFFAPPKYP